MTAHTYKKGSFFTTLDKIKGIHITVMGLGLNGGGLETVKFFLRYGAFVTATDKKTTQELLPTLKALKADKTLPLENLHLVLGEHKKQDFCCADCVIKNPVVKYETNEYLSCAKAIESDISVFLHFNSTLYHAPIIAVTGSKGKSTTASLIHYGLLKSGFKAFLGGNITKSPLSFMEQLQGDTPVVLELSSWQLRDLRGRGLLKPKIAVMTKIVADHQNWYDNMTDYVLDKELLFLDQDENDFLILPQGENAAGTDGLIEGFATWGQVFSKKALGKVLYYGENEIASCDTQNTSAFLCYNATTSTESGFLKLDKEPTKKECVFTSLVVPGLHNCFNALAAACTLHIMGVCTIQIKNILENWPGLEHRLEFFYAWQYKTPIYKSTTKGTIEKQTQQKKVLFYNDTTATVPAASSNALMAFCGNLVAICGGADKNLDFSPLTNAIIQKTQQKKTVFALYLLCGSGTQKLITLLQKQKINYSGPYKELKTLLQAIKQDFQKGSLSTFEGRQCTVVFSPGATSFEMFKNEFDRGNIYKDLVQQIF